MLDFIEYLLQTAINSDENREENQNKLIMETVADIDYKEKKLQNNHVDRNKGAGTLGGSALDTDWQENNNINAHYAVHRREIYDTMAELQQFWHGRLLRIDTDRISIKLSRTVVRPTNSSSQCS